MKVIYFVLFMYNCDISIKKTLFKVRLVGKTDDLYFTHTHAHTVTYTRDKRQKYTRSCQRNTAATESAIPGRSIKERCCINP